MKSKFFNEYTQPAIERNNTHTIPWTSILGESLDKFCVRGFEDNKSEQQVVADIINNHAAELSHHPRWQEKLLNNVGSRASRFRGELKKIKEGYIDPTKRASAIDLITELMGDMPISEKEYIKNLEMLRKLIE